MACGSSWWTGWWKSSRSTSFVLKLCTLLSTIWTASSPAPHMWNGASCSWLAQLHCWLLRKHMFDTFPVQSSHWFVKNVLRPDENPPYGVALIYNLMSPDLWPCRKYEEIFPPELSEFVYTTDSTYTKKQLLRMEHVFLRVLAFKMAAPTTNQFLHLFMSVHSVCANTENLALVSKINNSTTSQTLGVCLPLGFSLSLDHILIWCFLILVCGWVKPAGDWSIPTVHPIYSGSWSLLPSHLHCK